MRMRVPCVIGASVIFLAACGTTSPTAQPATTATPAATATPVATATPMVGSLADLFITTIPSGFALQPDSVGDTGPSDLAKAARDDGSANAAALLTQDGFAAGYQRLWARQSDGTYVVMFLYRFDDPTGATRYEQHGIGLLEGDPTAQKTALPVPGIRGATGLTGTVQGRPVVGIVYAKGDYLVQVAMQGTGATPDVAIHLAHDQFARLP